MSQNTSYRIVNLMFSGKEFNNSKDLTFQVITENKDRQLFSWKILKVYSYAENQN